MLLTQENGSENGFIRMSKRLFVLLNHSFESENYLWHDTCVGLPSKHSSSENFCFRLRRQVLGRVCKQLRSVWFSAAQFWHVRLSPSIFSVARFLTFLNNFHRIAWEKAVGSLCFYFLYGRLFCKYLHPNSELINFVWSARWFGNSVAKLRNKLPAQWKLEGKLKDHVTNPLLLETKPFLRCAMA